VQHRRADVEVAATPSQSHGDKTIDSDSEQSRDYHEAALNRLWIGEPARSFDRDENDDDDQGGAVHHRGKDADSMVAVGTPCIRRTLRLFDREPSQPEGDDVGQDVPRVRKKRQRVRGKPGRDLDCKNESRKQKGLL